MVDFHSHILPGIDDGAKNIDESIQILTMLKNQGVKTVVATPHYFSSVMSIETFLHNRNEAYNSLIRKIENEKISVPKIELGAEVCLTIDISTEDLYKLCIGNTNCILIEMPDGYWFDWTYNVIQEIISIRNLIPILAHLERYATNHNDIKRFEKLLRMNIYVQVNADSFREWRLRRIIKKIFEFSNSNLIGSDAHNLKDRKPKINIAHKKIIKKYGNSMWDLLLNNANSLLIDNAGELLD